MYRRDAIVCLLAGIGLQLVPGGCKQSDSILLIEVAGPNDLAPLQFRVLVTAGIETHSIAVPAEVGDQIVLPASFTIALDRSHTGPITVSIDAKDATGSPIGYGTTIMQHIEIGGLTVIPVMLMDGLPPDSPDAGADGAAGSGQGGEGGGGAGGGGAGGAGQGGASGSDGAADDGAMGLDSATD